MSRPSYASVTATIALVVALGGTSYAVTALPRNSVGTPQLKAHAVTKGKLAAGVVVSGPRGAQGPAGAPGAAGAAGAPGLSGVQIVSAGEGALPGAATAICPAGKQLIGGGAQSLSGGAISWSAPSTAIAAWLVRAPGAFAYAICATVTP